MFPLDTEVYPLFEGGGRTYYCGIMKLLRCDVLRRVLPMHKDVKHEDDWKNCWVLENKGRKIQSAEEPAVNEEDTIPKDEEKSKKRFRRTSEGEDRIEPAAPKTSEVGTVPEEASTEVAKNPGIALSRSMGRIAKSAKYTHLVDATVPTRQRRVTRTAKAKKKIAKSEDA